MKVLISLSGKSNVDIVKFVQKHQFDYIIGVDGGMDRLIAPGINCDLICGDFDSTKLEAAEQETKILKFDVKKDQTDFALTLEYLKANFATEIKEIIVIGFVSQVRFDHYQANLNLLEPKMTFVDTTTEIFLLEPGVYQYDFTNWEYVSFFAQEEIANLKLSGLEYHYDQKLDYLSNRTVCNRSVSGQKTEIEFQTGKLICILSNENE